MRVIALLLLAACSPRPSPTPREPTSRPASPYGRITTTRSAPEPFLGIAGLTQITESTTTPDEWGSTTTSRVLVYRGGAVVCEVIAGSSGAHENHSFSSSSRFLVSSQSPRRFLVYTTTRTNDLQVQPSCAEFELRDTGRCRPVFSQTCTEECRVMYATKLVPGTGVIRGRVTRAGEPLVGLTMVVGKGAEISNEEGVFSIATGAGRHELQIYDERQLEPSPIVPLGPKQDAELAITIECN